MAVILNIETATQVCSVAIGINGIPAASASENNPKAHSSRLTVLVDKALSSAGIEPKDLSAISISGGPGSFTGLRIGTAAAKGLCYSLGIPLISAGTLEAMAAGAVLTETAAADYLRPLIEARRGEVFSALFDRDLTELVKPSAILLQKDSFMEELDKGTVLFFGNGASKAKDIISHRHAAYLDGFECSAEFMCLLSENRYRQKQFEDTAYFEPFYLKDFYIRPRISS